MEPPLKKKKIMKKLVKIRLRRERETFQWNTARDFMTNLASFPLPLLTVLLKNKKIKTLNKKINGKIPSEWVCVEGTR